jgi:hypothetical protein
MGRCRELWSIVAAVLEKIRGPSLIFRPAGTAVALLKKDLGLATLAGGKQGRAAIFAKAKTGAIVSVTAEALHMNLSGVAARVSTNENARLQDSSVAKMVAREHVASPEHV